MIQRSMLGVLEPEEEQELQHIGRQRDVRNKGIAIQIPALNTTLVEAHQELAKTTREAKEIAEVCKRTTTTLEHMHAEWSTTKKSNEELTIQLE